MDRLGLTEVDLKNAFRQPGCPICRVCRERETRYLRNLLWENVNDVGTRLRISESMGFCYRHAWQLLHMEIKERIVPLGSSIIYEDLVGQMAHKIQNVLSCMTGSGRESRWQKVIDRLRSWLKRSEPRKDVGLTPQKQCLICESSQESALYAGRALVRMLSFAELQGMYNLSDGVCFSHLRDIVSENHDEPDIMLLLTNTFERLKVLEADVSEFKRKQNWQYRDENVTESEKAAAQRAVMFFSGPDLDKMENEVLTLQEPHDPFAWRDCPFRLIRHAPAENNLSSEVQHIICEAGNGIVLANDVSVANEADIFCQSCDIPRSLKYKHACLYLVPFRVFQDHDVQSYYACRWYLNMAPRNVPKDNDWCRACHNWFPRPAESMISEQIEYSHKALALFLAPPFSRTSDSV